MQRITTCLLPQMSYGNDQYMTVRIIVEGFPLKDMYSVLCQSDEDNKDDNWSKILKLGVPERVRCLMLILAHDRLLTNYTKIRMGMGYAMCSIVIIHWKQLCMCLGIVVIRGNMNKGDT